MNEQLENDSTCECTVYSLTNRGFIKDTVCGHSDFTNLVYLFTATNCFLALGVLLYFQGRILNHSSFVYTSRLKLMLLFVYIYAIGKIMKAADIIIHYSAFTYILIEDSAIFIVFAQFVYLTIWGQVVRQTYDTGSARFKTRAKILTILTDVLVGIICVVYLLPLIYTIAKGGRDYHSANPYHNFSMAIFTMMPIFSLSLGIWLLVRIQKVSGLIFTNASKNEAIINILLGALFPFFRGLYDWLDVLTDFYPQQFSNCQNTSIEWGFIMGYVGLCETLPIMSLFIFLIVSQRERNQIRYSFATTEHMQKEFLSKLKAQNPTIYQEQPIMIQPKARKEDVKTESDFSINQDAFSPGSYRGSSFLQRWGTLE